MFEVFEEMKIRHFLAIYISLFVVLAIGFVFFFPYNEELFTSSLYISAYVLVPLLYFSYHARHYRFSIRKVIFTNGVGKWIPSIVGMVFILIGMSLSSIWFLLYIVTPIFPPITDFLLQEVPLSENIGVLAIEIIAITILAPLVEELIFRGVILHRLIEKTSIWGGILISSILFGILHADMIGAFLFGVIASLLFIITGNLLVPILVHMLNNTIAVLLMFIAPTWPEWLSITEKADITSKAVPNAILLTVSSVLTFFLIRSLVRRMKKSLSDREKLSTLENEQSI